jgi:hypothetical protein
MSSRAWEAPAFLVGKCRMRSGRAEPPTSDALRKSAWVAFGFVLLVFLGYVALSELNDAVGEAGRGAAAREESSANPVTLAFLAFPICGVLIARRRPRNPIGWIMLAIGASWGLWGLLFAYSAYGAFTNPGAVPAPELALALGYWLWVPAVGLMGTFLVLLFPGGRLPSPRWRPWARFCACVLVAEALWGLVRPGPFPDTGFGAIQNALGIEALRPVAGALDLIVIALPVCILGCAASVVGRWRRSHGIERQQLKWLAAGGATTAVLYVLFIAAGAATTFGGLERSSTWVQIIGTVAPASFVLLPIAIGVALLRHRLYDVDVVVNQALVYASLTGVLAAVYLGAVLAVGSTLRAVTGQRAGTLAVAASTLAVAALFRPARARIQAFIDRRFYRSKYDAAQTVTAFIARLRDEIDLEAMSRELVTVVGDTMQPSHLSLWLRPPDLPAGVETSRVP